MSKINPEYANSQIIDYNRWSDHPEVEGLVTHLLENYSSRKRYDFAANMKVVLLNLYQSYLNSPERYVAYHRGAPHYTNLKADVVSRYHKNPHISQTKLVGVVNHLVSCSLIQNSIGGYFADENGSHGFLSRMRATQALVGLWQEYRLSPAMISRFKPDEVIIQRGKPYKDENNNKVKPLVYYSDNRVTRSMRLIVNKYNNLLDVTDIDINLDRMPKADTDELVQMLTEYDNQAISLNLSNKHVYRVFNNKSWEQGGRFYGAWWIGCPSLLRKYITINGNSTVELDYSGIHINLLYAVEGINYSALKEDPYILDDGIPDRSLNKLILLTALNAKDDSTAIDSVYNELRKSSDLSKYNIIGKGSKGLISDKIKLLKLKHSKIAKYIAEGEGIYLQFHDSCVLEKLINYSTVHNIPILTVHDSVVIQSKYKNRIYDRMLKYYSEYINNKLGCSDNYEQTILDKNIIFTKLIDQDIWYKLNSDKYYIFNKYVTNNNGKYSNVNCIPTNSNITIKLTSILGHTKYSLYDINRLIIKKIHWWCSYQISSK